MDLLLLLNMQKTKMEEEQQHFKPVEHFGGQEGFKKRIYYDNIKNNFCKEKNIPLLRIKYNENIIEKLKNFLKENNFNAC